MEDFIFADKSLYSFCFFCFLLLIWVQVTGQQPDQATAVSSGARKSKELSADLPSDAF